jgi:peptide/nickel transport system substrate-binding protein
MKSLKLIACISLAMILIVSCAPAATQAPAAEAPASEAPAEAAPAEQAGETPAEEAPAAAGEPLELVYGMTSIMATLNPAIGWTDYYSRGLFLEHLIDDALLGGQKPALATEWSVDESGTVWTFKIREGVKYHDGTPCTANEIAWSLNFTIEKELPTMQGYVEGISEVAALDDYTLQITTEEPIGPFLSRMSDLGMFILPPSVWQDMTADEVLEYQEMDAAIGTGPYKVTEYVSDEYIILDAFEDHWAGKPAIDRIILRAYANNDALYEAMRNGEVDAAYIGAEAVNLLSAEDHLTIFNGPAWGITEMIVNAFAEGTQPDSLNDPIVRKAIAHAVDKEQYVNTITLGTATPGWSIITPDHGDWYNTDVQDITYDVVEGNRLLDEAGYVDSDGDGIRNWSDGSNMVYRIYSPESMSDGPRVLEMFAGWLGEIGIGSDQQVLSDETIISLYPAYDFDFLFWGWGWGGSDPDFPLSCFVCDQTMEGGWNDAGYCNPDFDALYQAQARETDPESRKEIVWEAQQVFFNDLPYIILAYDVNIMAINSDKFGFLVPVAEEYGHPLIHASLIAVELP